VSIKGEKTGRRIVIAAVFRMLIVAALAAPTATKVSRHLLEEPRAARLDANEPLTARDSGGTC
jgi:hypothetical protein